MWSAGPNQFVEAECADLPPGRALDLAAGEGRNALWLARRGWQVTAVDFSQVALDKGREVAGDADVEWVVARRADAGRADRPYDLVVLAYLQLEPRPSAAAAIRSAFAALRPGGTLLVVAHDSTQPDRGHRRAAGRERALHRRGRARRPRRRGVDVVRAERVERRCRPGRRSGTASMRSCGWYAVASIAA